MLNSYTKNSNVASEGDQTLCNYKRVFLKKLSANSRYILFLFLVILRIHCLDRKVTNFLLYISIDKSMFLSIFIAKSSHMQFSAVKIIPMVGKIEHTILI